MTWMLNLSGTLYYTADGQKVIYVKGTRKSKSKFITTYVFKGKEFALLADAQEYAEKH